MKISTMLSYSGGFREAAAEVAELEKAGLDLVWVAEAYGLDGPSLMGYLAALTERVEIGSAILPDLHPHPDPHRHDRGRYRHPVRVAASISVSGRRVPRSSRAGTACPSTPPIGRTREIIDVCRQVWAREAPLVHEGTLLRHAPPGRAGDRAGQGRSRSSPTRCGRRSRSGWPRSARRTWP